MNPLFKFFMSVSVISDTPRYLRPSFRFETIAKTYKEAHDQAVDMAKQMWGYGVNVKVITGTIETL